MYILQLPENQVISGSPSVKPIIPLIRQGEPLAHKGNVAYPYLTHWDWKIRLWNHIYLVIFNSNQGYIFWAFPVKLPSCEYCRPLLVISKWLDAVRQHHCLKKFWLKFMSHMSWFGNNEVIISRMNSTDIGLIYLLSKFSTVIDVGNEIDSHRERFYFLWMTLAMLSVKRDGLLHWFCHCQWCNTSHGYTMNQWYW